MRFRAILLRVMFISLAAAAAFGAIGVLTANATAVWRVTGTCAATAVAALAMLLAAHRLDDADHPLPGTLAVGLIVSEYLLSLLLIWDVPLLTIRDWRVAAVMFFLAADGIPAITFVRLLHRPSVRIAARVGLVLAGIDFAIFMAAVVSPQYGSLDDHCYELGAALAGFGLAAVLSLVGAGTAEGWRYVRWLGVTAATVAFFIAAWAIIEEIHAQSAVFTTIASIAVVAAHANLVLLCPLKPSQRWLRWGTMGAAVLTAVFIDWMAALDRLEADFEFLQRLTSAAAIVAGCGTLALLVLAKLNRRLVGPAPAITELREVAIVCPMCQQKQAVGTGRGQCSRCGLIISIKLEEPRCPACGYTLLMLQSARCPECGHDLPGRVPPPSLEPVLAGPRDSLGGAG